MEAKLMSLGRIMVMQGEREVYKEEYRKKVL